jgi:hypothetical protein
MVRLVGEVQIMYMALPVPIISHDAFHQLNFRKDIVPYSGSETCTHFYNRHWIKLQKTITLIVLLIWGILLLFVGYEKECLKGNYLTKISAIN